MNQRIEELIKQSYFYDVPNDSTIFDREKFAKLIVLECAELVEYNSKGAGRDIKEHFGVTEDE